MRKTIEIKHIKLKHRKAPLHYATCGDVASIILPSYTIPLTSPSAVKCDAQTGELTLPKRNKFLRESSIREMDDVLFRISAYENAGAIQMLSHKPANEFGLSDFLDSFVTMVPQTKIRFCYGGDIVSIPGTLQCVLNLAAKHPEKQFFCATGNGSALTELSIEAACGGCIMPPNIYLFCEDGGEDETTLFPCIRRTETGAIPDSPDFFPDENKSIELQIDPQSADRRQKQVSWWQPTKLKS